MSNLSIEGLNRVTQTGDIEKLFSPGLESGEKVAGGGEASTLGNSGKTFADLLKESVNQTNVDQVQADVAMKELIAGRSKNIHETMLTIEKADTSLKLMMQVRNKIIDAYREIMRMQV